MAFPGALNQHLIHATDPAASNMQKQTNDFFYIRSA